MLNRKTPETLTTKLTIKAPGDTFTVPVEFYNRTQPQINAFNDELVAKGMDVEDINREMFCYVVKEIDGETPTADSVADAEARFPGFITGVFTAFHQLRLVSIAKN